MEETIKGKYKTKLIQRMNVFSQMKQMEANYQKGKEMLIEFDSSLRTMKELNPEIDHEAIVEEIKKEYEEKQKQEKKEEKPVPETENETVEPEVVEEKTEETK